MGLNEWEDVGTWTSSVKQCTRTKTSDSRKLQANRATGDLERTEMVKGRQAQSKAAAHKGDSRFATGVDRVSSNSLVPCTLEGINSNFFGGIAIHGDSVSNVTDFKALDDRAAEILNKSMQALQSSHGLETRYCNSAHQVVMHGWACDKFEHLVPRSLQHNETSADVSSGTIGRDLLDSGNIQLECSGASAFPLKVGGASSQKEKRSSEKDVTKEDTPARITSNPNNCNAETTLVDKTLMFSSDDGDGRGRVNPRRWARMSARPPSGQMNTNIHLKEEVTTDNSSQNLITENHPKNSAETQKNEIEGYRSKWRQSGLPEEEWCQMERTRCCVKEHERGTFDISNSLRRMLSRYGLASSQGASGWPSSGTDSRPNDHLLECLNQLDISGRSEKTSTVWTVPASLKRFDGAEKEYTPAYKEEYTSLKSAEHLQNANQSSKLDWTQPCTPLVHLKPKDLSATGNSKAPSDRPLDGVVHLPSAPETTSKTIDVSSHSAPETTSETPAATIHHRETPETPPTLKSLMPHRKTLPVNLVSRRGRTNGTKRRRLLTTQVKDFTREYRKTGTVQNGIFLAPQKSRTAVEVNITITHLVDKEQEATNRRNDPLNLTRENKGAQTQPERVQNEELGQNSISAETIGHPETETNENLSASITSAETVKYNNPCVCQLLKEGSQIPQLSSNKLPVVRTKPTGEDADIDRENSVLSSEKLHGTQKSQEDYSSKSTVIPNSRTPPRTGNQKVPTGVRFWPRVIPELDDWIHETVSGLFQKEESLLDEELEGTSVKVCTQGSSNALKSTNPVKLETSTRETSRGRNPSNFQDATVSKLDTDIKRLAMLDSRINKATSINDLVQALEGISSFQGSTKQTLRSNNVRNSISTG